MLKRDTACTVSEALARIKEDQAQIMERIQDFKKQYVDSQVPVAPCLAKLLMPLFTAKPLGDLSDDEEATDALTQQAPATMAPSPSHSAANALEAEPDATVQSQSARPGPADEKNKVASVSSSSSSASSSPSPPAPAAKAKSSRRVRVKTKAASKKRPARPTDSKSGKASRKCQDLQRQRQRPGTRRA